MKDVNLYRIKADTEDLVIFAEVQRVTSLSASTIRRRVKDGLFPPPVPGLARPRWKRLDIETYLDWRQPLPWTPWMPPS